jgi:hypothetical protein
MLRAMRLQRRLMAEGGLASPAEPVVVDDEIVQQNEPGAVAYPKTVRS